MSASLSSTEVFVIGGGPAGLAAAIALRRRGLAVTVADATPPPIDKVCGEGIMPDGIAAARAIGIDIGAMGPRPFRGIRFSVPDASVEAVFPAAPGLALRRTTLHRGMVRTAEEAGVRMAWGVCVTGITGEGAMVDGRLVRARWIVGADGGRSLVRRWAGLDACHRDSSRYGFRRHYRVAPWSEFMEIHWTRGFQLYVTPVSGEEVCAVVISHDPHLRLDAALRAFPAVERRLRAAAAATPERGGVSATRRLRSVARGRVALVGDASGSVDAITGDGMYLLFSQAAALADALAAGHLESYEASHRRIRRRPCFMAGLMLEMGRRNRLRGRMVRAMAQDPRLFSRMLAMHVGQLSVPAFLANGLALAWQMVTV